MAAAAISSTPFRERASSESRRIVSHSLCLSCNSTATVDFWIIFHTDGSLFLEKNMALLNYPKMLSNKECQNAK